MKKTSRWTKVLFGMVMALVAIAAAGWLAATGKVDWLARFAHPRIVAALGEAGVETDELKISRLTLEGGRVEHAKLRTPAGVLEAHGVEVALGWENIRAGKAGAITVERLELTPATVSATGEGKSAVPLDGLPFDSVEIREWRASVLLGGRMREVSGKASVSNGSAGSLLFSGNFLTSGAAGMFEGEAYLTSGRTELHIADLVLKPEVGPDWVDPFLSAAISSVASYDWKTATGLADVTLQSGSPITVRAGIIVSDGTVNHPTANGGFASLSLRIEWSREGSLQMEADFEGVAARSESWSGSATTLQLVGNREKANVAFGNAGMKVGNREARGHGLGVVKFGEWFEPESAEGTVVLESAEFDGLSAGAGEIPFRWEGDALSATVAHLGITGWTTAEVEGLQVQLTELGRGEPGISGSAVLVVDAGALSRFGIGIAPASQKMTTTFLGLLADGRESLRLEFQADAAQRSLETGSLSGSAFGAFSGVVTLDPNHVSGSLAGDWTDVAVKLPGDRGAVFRDVAFKWTLGRTWIEAVRGWSDLEIARSLREVLWVSNIDISGEGGAVNLGNLGRAEGVSLKALSNGADLSELAGGLLSLTAGRVQTAQAAFGNATANLSFGLDGGTASADVELSSPRISVRSRQTVNWADGFSLSGEYSTPSIDLSSIGPLDGLASGLAGVTVTGVVSAIGNIAYRESGVDADARIELSGVGIGLPGGKGNISGINGVIAFDSVKSLRTPSAQQVTFEGAKFTNLELSKGTLEFEMPSWDRVEVLRLEAAAMGGTVSASRFSFDPADPKPATSLRLDGVEMEQLLGFFPDVPVAADAAIVGELPIAWDGRELTIGNGFIDLQPGELGRVWFNYDTRMLTQGLSANSPFLPTFRRIERAMLDLYFNRLRIDLHPPGSPGRTLQVRLVGVTAAGDVKAPITLDVNVNVPLERFFKWGAGNPLKP